MRLCVCMNRTDNIGRFWGRPVAKVGLQCVPLFKCVWCIIRLTALLLQTKWTPCVCAPQLERGGNKKFRFPLPPSRQLPQVARTIWTLIQRAVMFCSLVKFKLVPQSLIIVTRLRRQSPWRCLSSDLVAWLCVAGGAECMTGVGRMWIGCCQTMTHHGRVHWEFGSIKWEYNRMPYIVY